MRSDMQVPIEDLGGLRECECGDDNVPNVLIPHLRKDEGGIQSAILLMVW